jgi:uncharacterized protein YbjQ (UPF0145 family)
MEMLMTTIGEVPGREILRVLGLVRGASVRARDLRQDLMAGIKNVVGGEVSEYTKLIAEAREEALDRMCAQAEANGANAVVGVRFASSEVMEGAAELLAYGTAVVLGD